LQKEDVVRSKSSWDEYMGLSKIELCENDKILGQFKSKKEYKKFAENTFIAIRQKKILAEEKF
jgi:hypothetical protein